MAIFLFSLFSEGHNILGIPVHSDAHTTKRPMSTPPFWCHRIARNLCKSNTGVEHSVVRLFLSVHLTLFYIPQFLEPVFTNPQKKEEFACGYRVSNECSGLFFFQDLQAKKNLDCYFPVLFIIVLARTCGTQGMEFSQGGRNSDCGQDSISKDQRTYWAYSCCTFLQHVGLAFLEGKTILFRTQKCGGFRGFISAWH